MNGDNRRYIDIQDLENRKPERKPRKYFAEVKGRQLFSQDERNRSDPSRSDPRRSDMRDNQKRYISRDDNSRDNQKRFISRVDTSRDDNSRDNQKRYIPRDDNSRRPTRNYEQYSRAKTVDPRAPQENRHFAPQEESHSIQLLHEKIAELKKIIRGNEARIDDLKKDVRYRNKVIYRLNNGLLELRPKNSDKKETTIEDLPESSPKNDDNVKIEENEIKTEERFD